MQWLACKQEPAGQLGHLCVKFSMPFHGELATPHMHVRFTESTQEKKSHYHKWNDNNVSDQMLSSSTAPLWVSQSNVWWWTCRIRWIHLWFIIFISQRTKDIFLKSFRVNIKDWTLQELQPFLQSVVIFKSSKTNWTFEQFHCGLSPHCLIKVKSYEAFRL